jgi:hypothetical protein
MVFFGCGFRTNKIICPDTKRMFNSCICFATIDNICSEGDEFSPEMKLVGEWVGDSGSSEMKLVGE